MVCNVQSLVLETLFSWTTSPKYTFEFKEIQLQKIKEVLNTLNFAFSTGVVEYRNGYSISTVRNKMMGWGREQCLLADGWQVVMSFVLMRKKNGIGKGQLLFRSFWLAFSAKE